MAYKHGVYGVLGATIPQNPVTAADAPVYVGRAPLHLASAAASTNVPILITSFADAEKKLGYCTDWADYELCEAVYAHFKNPIMPIGPIVVINVFDPATHNGASDTTASLAAVNGRIEIDDADCIVGTITLADSESAAITAFAAKWDSLTERVIIRETTSGALTGTITVTYRKATPASVTAAEIIGTVTNGTYTGLQCADLVYQYLGLVPCALCAPAWDATTGVYPALIAKATSITGRFFAMVHADLPVTAGYTNVAEVKASKALLPWTESAKIYWPRATDGTHTYHLSVLAIVRAMQTDYAAGGYPYETPSNKELPITGTQGASAPLLISIDAANDLNEAGVTTAILWGGIWRLWGAHTAIYGYGDAMLDPRATYDTNMRMLYYVLNKVQTDYGDRIDKPLTKNTLESIAAEIQAWLDALKSSGALTLGTVTAVIDDDATDELINGHLRIAMQATAPVPLSSITAELSYSVAGLNMILE